MSVLDKLSHSLKEKLNRELAEIANQEQTTGTRAKKSSLSDTARVQAAKIRQELDERQRQIKDQEAELARQRGALEERQKSVKEQAANVERGRAQVESLKKKQVVRLEKIAGLSKDQAKDLLLKATEKKLADQLARQIKEAKEAVRDQVEAEAKEILVDAMQHGLTDHVAEYTVSTVTLPDEDIKGRIIGREGRNIRAFERATGVEIELDESNALHLSSFDPIRREVARRALQKLVRDRRIQPSRIEEIVKKTRQEMDKVLQEEGEKLCHAVKVYRLHPELVKLLGRFKFRYSYGQNLMIHTLEETKIGVQLAYEVGANVNVVRLGCLLHDIGKVVNEEEGTHVQLGVDLARQYRLPKPVVDCIAEHHEDKPFSSAESRVVWIADAISGSRPGARYEPHEKYVERIGQIEEIAGGFDGVREAFAYQAGRDVRVLVKPEEVSDSELTVLASNIASTLEEKASYAGQIKVTCIREVRVSENTKAK